jgi:hypothetical protein
MRPLSGDLLFAQEVELDLGGEPVAAAGEARYEFGKVFARCEIPLRSWPFPCRQCWSRRCSLGQNPFG